MHRATLEGRLLVQYGETASVRRSRSGDSDRRSSSGPKGRLLPVTLAHLLVNFMTSSPAVVFPIMVLAGVVEV